MSIEREGAKESSHFDHLPRTYETVRALGEYVEAKQVELGPLLRQKAGLQIHLEVASQRLRASREAKADNDEIRRLEATLRSLRGEPEPALPADDADDAEKLAEAQTAYDQAKQQFDDISQQVDEEDAKLLARFGLS